MQYSVPCVATFLCLVWVVIFSFSGHRTLSLLSMPCTFNSGPEAEVEESERESEWKKRAKMRLYVGVFLHSIRFSIYNGFECKRCVRNVTERVCRRGLFVISFFCLSKACRINVVVVVVGFMLLLLLLSLLTLCVRQVKSSQVIVILNVCSNLCSMFRELCLPFVTTGLWQWLIWYNLCFMSLHCDLVLTKTHWKSPADSQDITITKSPWWHVIFFHMDNHHQC